MSGESRVAGADRTTTAVGSLRRFLDDIERRTVVYVAALVTLMTVAGSTLLRILQNLPFDPVAVPPPLTSMVTGAVPVVAAAALIAIGVASPRGSVRIGLLFVGVFGALAAVSPRATLPAVVAIVAGSSVTLVGTTGRPTTYRAARPLAVGCGFVAAVAVSLSASTGLVDGGQLGLGALLTLLAVIATGYAIDGDRLALAIGVAVTLGIVAASLASPFIVGSALLVSFAVVGVPHVLAAVAAGTGVAVAVAALRAGNVARAAGACLVILAGVPATIPTALVVVLGATLVIVDIETLTGEVPA